MRQMTAIDLNLQTRDRELTEIARSIASLAELFKDLSVLVIDQGTLLDSVEYNIEQTAAHMEDAVRELDVATKYVPPLLLLLALRLPVIHSRPGTVRASCPFWSFHSSKRTPLPLSSLVPVACAPSCMDADSAPLPCFAQVPEEHRAATVHLPPPADHIRPHHCPHLQTATALCHARAAIA